MWNKNESDVGRISIRPTRLDTDTKRNWKRQCDVADKYHRANTKTNYNFLTADLSTTNNEMKISSNLLNQFTLSLTKISIETCSTKAFRLINRCSITDRTNGANSIGHTFNSIAQFTIKYCFNRKDFSQYKARKSTWKYLIEFGNDFQWNHLDNCSDSSLDLELLRSHTNCLVEMCSNDALQRNDFIHWKITGNFRTTFHHSLTRKITRF